MLLSPRREPLPEDTEARLTDFTELVATAIANAESRVAIGRLVDEQAALRRRRHSDDDRQLERRRPMLPIGTRFPLDGDSLAARIFESGAPARMHSYDEAWEREATDLARSLRVRSAVGAPILVEGKLWGALMAATRGVEPWAENA